MKNILYLFSILSFVLTSCKEDIEPSLDGKISAVVYGLLDQNDTIHYVKINRAFYGAGDATQIALVSDSSYFKTVEASVKEYQGGTLKRTWNLKDTIISNKENGAFFGPEQKVFYFKTSKATPLIADGFTEYRFEATMDKGLSNECTITGKTVLISGFGIKAPKTQLGPSPGSFKFAFNDAQVNGYSKTTVNILVGAAKLVEAKLTVAFDEYINGTLTHSKEFDWKLGEADDSYFNGGEIGFDAQGLIFYDLISKNATNDKNITKRTLKSIKITAAAANEDLQKYIILNKPSSSLAQNKPTFTNLKISNNMRVIGVFASRNVISSIYVENIFNGTKYFRSLDEPSMKELCFGQYTNSLNFCSIHNDDFGKTFYCN